MIKAILALVLLFIFVDANAAFIYCGYVGKFLQTCPAGLTDPLAGDSVTDTTTNVSVVSDQSTGILYKTVIPEISDCSVEQPSLSDIKDGTGSDDFDNDPTPIVGTNSFSYTGLTASTDYCDWSYQESTQLTDSNITLAEFTTLPGGAALQGRFVNSNATGCGGGGCSDSNDGLTDATAWLTVAKVSTAGLPVGTDVWFKESEKWEESPRINWDGSVGDRVIFGIYNMSPNETRGLSSDTDPGSPDTAQSTWQGATFFSDFDTGYTEGGRFTPLVEVLGIYITVENINCWMSNGNCFEVDKDSGGNAIFDNVMSHISAGSAYSANRDAGSNEVKNSEFSLASYCWGNQLAGCTAAGQWHSCTKHVRSDNNSFHDNIVRECWGEGMGNSGENSGNTISDNVFIWIRSAVLYANGSANNIFERNVVLGCARQNETSICKESAAVKSFYRNTQNTGTAAQIAYENSSYSVGITASGNIFRNNLFVGVGLCFGVSAESQAKADNNAKVGGSFLGNTCVYSDFYWRSDLGGGNVATIDDPVIIKNNIFAALHPSASGENCKDSGRIAGGEFIEDFNGFENNDASDVNCDQGANTVVPGDPDFTQTDFSDPSPTNRFTSADIELGTSSDFDEVGTTDLANMLDDINKTLRPVGSQANMGANED